MNVFNRRFSAQRHLLSAGAASAYQGMASNNGKALQITSRYVLNSSYQIPVLGYGVYKTPASVAESVVLHAFRTGYRHVDSARAYRNEQPCAEAITSSTHSIPRSEIFFTSKVPPRAMGYEATKKSISSTLSQTGLDYVDLYLIHCPYGGRESRLGTWDALLSAQKAGQIRSLGVSNYGVHHLNELESHIRGLESKHGPGEGGTISVGQWELHPWLPRDDIVTWCCTRNIVIEAYCPLVRGERATSDAILTELAARHGKTWAQVLLRWSLQKGFVPIPKSVTPSRIEENADIYDFELSALDMETLERKGAYEPCSWDPTVSDD